jgi:type II secretory pathway pseudopilin PulG
MTLLEALIATVILSVVAIACLEGTRGAASLQYRTGVASDVVAIAEAAMARAQTGAPVDPREARVTRAPYALHGLVLPLDELVVEVPRAGGGTVRLTRLVPSRTGAR